MTKRLYRSRKNRVIAGVAAGIADYFDIDPIIVRLLFVILAFGQGSGLLAYIIGWIVIPEEPETVGDKNEKKNPSGSDIETKKLAMTAPKEDHTESSGEERPRQAIGIVFVCIGAILLIQNLIGYHFWRIIAPLALVAVGLAIVLRNMRTDKS